MQPRPITEIFAHFEQLKDEVSALIHEGAPQALEGIINQVGKLRGKEVIYDTDLAPIDVNITEILTRVLPLETTPEPILESTRQLLAQVKAIVDQLKLHQKVAEQFSTAIVCSSRSPAGPSAAIEPSPEVIAAHESKVIFPHPILNAGGACYVSSPIQGLMRSPGFLAYLDWKEKNFHSSEPFSEILSLMLTIKHQWQLGNPDQISLYIRTLQELFIRNHPDSGATLGDGDANQFLELFLKDIGFTSYALEESPHAVSTSLFNHLDEHQQALQEVVTDEYQDQFSTLPTPPKTIVFWVTFNDSRSNNDLQFSENSPIVLFDREGNLHSYRVSSFTYYPAGHYTQCLQINGQWYECDHKSIFLLTPSELSDRKARACTIFVDKIEEGVDEEITIPPNAKINSRTPLVGTSARTSLPARRSPPISGVDLSKIRYSPSNGSTSSTTSSLDNILSEQLEQQRIYSLERMRSIDKMVKHDQPTIYNVRTHFEGVPVCITADGKTFDGTFIKRMFKGTITYPENSEIKTEEGAFLLGTQVDDYILCCEKGKRVYRDGRIEEGHFFWGNLRQQ